jgi:hypothetical protein
LAEQLLLPPEPPLRGPTISFDPPPGWKVKVVPFRLDMRKGKLITVIMAINESDFAISQWQFEQPWVGAPGWQADVTDVEISQGECVGKKRMVQTSAPIKSKQVDYLLTVPGGYVLVLLCSTAEDFDELPIESKLHTIRLSAPT